MRKKKIKIIFEGDKPIRLDKHLANLRLQELNSRSHIERLIADDKILVNKVPVKKSYLLARGDEIDLNMPKPPEHEVYAQDIPLDVVYEDDDLVVINKATGMIVHPGHGNPDGTLVNALLHHYPGQLSRGRHPNRPGIVHRLDRGTSGLIIVAKTDPAQKALNRMFAKREIQKTYLAICCGIPDPPEGTIENSIGRSLSNPRQMCVSRRGRQAISHYKTIKYYENFSLIKISLETGRMHQIRVHLAHRNNPILGDLLYNTRRFVHSQVPDNMKRKVTELLTTRLLRQALHAWRLNFIQPISGEELDLCAPLPEDFIYTLDWLEKYFMIDTDDASYNVKLEENKKW